MEICRPRKQQTTTGNGAVSHETVTGRSSLPQQAPAIGYTFFPPRGQSDRNSDTRPFLRRNLPFFFNEERKKAGNGGATCRCGSGLESTESLVWGFHLASLLCLVWGFFSLLGSKLTVLCVLDKHSTAMLHLHLREQLVPMNSYCNYFMEKQVIQGYHNELLQDAAI